MINDKKTNKEIDRFKNLYLGFEVNAKKTYFGLSSLSEKRSSGD